MDNDNDLFPDIFLNRLPHLTHIAIGGKWPHDVNVDLSIFRMCKQLKELELYCVILVPCRHDLHGCTDLEKVCIKYGNVKDTTPQGIVDATPGLNGKRRLRFRDNTLSNILASLPSNVEILNLSFYKGHTSFKRYKDVYSLDGIRHMTSLNRLILDYIGFTMEDDTLASLINLESIDIIHSISMVIPKSISALASLKHLYVNYYNLERPLPDSLYTMTSLETLHFSNGTGLDPDTLRIVCDGQIASNLLDLDLGNSRLNSRFPSPSQLVNLKKVTWIELEDNDLCGDINMNTIDSMPNLSSIDIKNNCKLYVDTMVYKTLRDRSGL